MTRTYTKMTMKFPNSCALCKTQLHPSTIAFGSKSDITGKWTFLCQKCYDTTMIGAASEVVNSDGRLEDLIEMIEGNSIANDIGNMLEDDCDGVSADDMLKPGAVKKTILQLIKENAVYGRF